ncbi:MLXIPL [Cordylochernes scorpioides]|uniref:MLXIPL n=1 Tax=Cordylochernes scorpioides TaxID=51811 RepID=A0ABY6KP94_9ARAC|nr:MLXIPL [Cordylochernes scorpioides]
MSTVGNDPDWLCTEEGELIASDNGCGTKQIKQTEGECPPCDTKSGNSTIGIHSEILHENNNDLGELQCDSVADFCDSDRLSVTTAAIQLDMTELGAPWKCGKTRWSKHPEVGASDSTEGDRALDAQWKSDNNVCDANIEDSMLQGKDSIEMSRSRICRRRNIQLQMNAKPTEERNFPGHLCKSDTVDYVQDGPIWTSCHNGAAVIDDAEKQNDAESKPYAVHESDYDQESGQAAEYDFEIECQETSRTYKFGPRSSQSISIDASLTKLFECMTLAYRHNILTIDYKHKDSCNHTSCVQPVVIEGKYWSQELSTVTAEYKKWRLFYKDRTKLNRSSSNEKNTYEGSESDCFSALSDPAVVTEITGGQEFMQGPGLLDSLICEDQPQPDKPPLMAPQLQPAASSSGFLAFDQMSAAAALKKEGRENSDLPGYHRHKAYPSYPGNKIMGSVVKLTNHRPAISQTLFSSAPQPTPILPAQPDALRRHSYSTGQLPAEDFQSPPVASPRQFVMPESPVSFLPHHSGVLEQQVSDVVQAKPRVRSRSVSSPQTSQNVLPQNAMLAQLLTSCASSPNAAPTSPETPVQKLSCVQNSPPPPKPFRPRSSEERVQYKEHRRVCHINAEQKRRFNIKSGFETLRHLLPSLSQSPTAKVAKAAMLQKFVQFSLVLQPLVESYGRATAGCHTAQDFCEAVIGWVDRHCTLLDLRRIVLNALRQLSTRTNILTNPAHLPEELMQKISKKEL